ncbi:MAG: hypothetical protein ACYC9O_05655 [Candidatus Latescibacterota bacterium]
MNAYNRSLVYVAMLVLFSCSKNTTSHDNTDDGSKNSISRHIQASAGGTVQISNGVAISIPPDALKSDTLVTVSEIDIDRTDANMLAGVRFEPDGLELSKPALITVPIETPSNWKEGDLVHDYDFTGADAGSAVWSGYYARVIYEDGKWVAKTFTTHFSGKLFIRNCHSGTMDYVIGQFRKKGCHPDTIVSMVRRKYPANSIQGYQTEKVDELTIQRFLGTFFNEMYTYNRGEKIPGDVLAELTAHVRSGRNVVLAFTADKWGTKSGEGLYPAYAHTAALEERNGVVQIRNSANIRPIPKLIELLGGTNTVYYPFDKLDEFREMQAGVAVELAAGVGPDGFSSSQNNPYGLDIYNPLNGKNWTGFAWEDPFAFTSALLSGNVKSVSGIPPRPRPWTAVKIYVQNTAGNESPCETNASVAQLPYTHIDIFLHVTCRVNYSDGKEYVQLRGIRQIQAGGFKGGMFTASWDSTANKVSTLETYKGNLSVTVDPITLKLGNFTLNCTSTILDKNHNMGSTLDTSASGANIQFKKSDFYTMEANIYGKEIGKYMQTFIQHTEYSNQPDAAGIVNVTPVYADGDYIKIRFWF